MNDNPFYRAGYQIGLKYGSISQYQKMILSNEFLNISVEELQKMINDVYAEFEERLPKEFLEEKELERQDLVQYFWGYTDGRSKHSRNKADKKYHEKVGLKSKSYKLHKDVIEAFANACEKQNVSLSATLEKLMMQFVEETKEQYCQEKK